MIYFRQLATFFPIFSARFRKLNLTCSEFFNWMKTKTPKVYSFYGWNKTLSEPVFDKTNTKFHVYGTKVTFSMQTQHKMSESDSCFTRLTQVSQNAPLYLFFFLMLDDFLYFGVFIDRIIETEFSSAFSDKICILFDSISQFKFRKKHIFSGLLWKFQFSTFHFYFPAKSNCIFWGRNWQSSYFQLQSTFFPKRWCYIWQNDF